ncbi:MAG: hypothetical protein JW909_08540 [Planctomycetes bacterium]|nr:hypothetical protein [Planctomycetota bacterium]
MKPVLPAILAAAVLAGCVPQDIGPVVAAPTRIDVPAQDDDAAMEQPSAEPGGDTVPAEEGADGVSPAPGDGPAADTETTGDAGGEEPAPENATPPVEPSGAEPSTDSGLPVPGVVIGADGEGGDIDPVAVKLLKGRLRPPAAVDIDGDGTPELEVRFAGENKSFYEVLSRQPGSKAASMVWLYDRRGRLTKFERDIDLDGIVDEVLHNLDGDTYRVFRSGSGEAFIMHARGDNLSVFRWPPKVGRPLVSEIVKSIETGAAGPGVLEDKPCETAIWAHGRPASYSRADGAIPVETVLPAAALSSGNVFPNNTVSRRTIREEFKRPASRPAPDTAPPADAGGKGKADAVLAVSRPKHRGTALYSGVCFAEGKPRRYALYRLTDANVPGARGVPSDVMSEWKRSLEEMFVLDLQRAERWFSRMYALKDGRIAWERRDEDGDGRFETQVLISGRNETITEKKKDGVVTRSVYYGGDLIQSLEDADGDGRFEKASYFRLGELERVEIDTDGNGRVDRWEFVKDGKLLEDSNADGLPDRWGTLKGAQKSD